MQKLDYLSTRYSLRLVIDRPKCVQITTSVNRQDVEYNTTHQQRILWITTVSVPNPRHILPFRVFISHRTSGIIAWHHNNWAEENRLWSVPGNTLLATPSWWSSIQSEKFSDSNLLIASINLRFAPLESPTLSTLVWKSISTPAEAVLLAIRPSVRNSSQWHRGLSLLECVQTNGSDQWSTPKCRRFPSRRGLIQWD